MTKPKHREHKTFYVRSVAGNKLSVGIYVAATWRNLVRPFHPDNADAVSELRSIIMDYQKASDRIVIFEAYSNPDTVAILQKAIDNLPPYK